MSTEIEQRVVEMRFDNKHFENNVSTTMSTLDKLKQKLHLDGATKGLENINVAAGKVNMAGLGAGVEAVSMKFSALQVVGVTALQNITNSAINTGKRMLSALTIDPVKTGFQEYETQINAVQTILANTKSKGSTIDDVNVALDELNKYADMTIYNFTEMTRNIGTFTAAGIDLDTSVNAIQGIANLAAVSGSTSQQASTAMYQLSQALAAGTIRLMDWNSVVNAGMGGEVFQNALRETSEELGTGAEAAIKASGSFRESLKDGWLTADVLTATLKKFTSSGANEYVAEYTGLSTEAVEIAMREGEAVAEAAKARGEEVDAIDAAAEALAEKSGKNKQEIFDMLDFARTATDAATKVKTFTQLWEVLKESAQSGWSQTWKLIVGDFEEAKELLTPLADTLTGFINKMSDARNRVLQVALDFASPWTTMMDKFSNITKVVKDVENATNSLEYFQDIVTKVWRGDYDNGSKRRSLLTEAGYDPRVVQHLVNKGYEYKITVEDIEKAHEKFGLTMEQTTEETEKTAATLDDVSAAFNELNDDELINIGLTQDEIDLYRALESEAEKAGISVADLAEEMSNANGRDMMIDSFKNLGDIVVGLGKAIGQAWTDVINPPGLEVMGIRLYGLISRFKEFTESLRLTDAETGELNENGLKFQRIFKGVFALVDIVATIVGGPLKIAFKVVGQILGFFGMTIIDVLAVVGDVISTFHDWLEAIFDISGILEVVVPLIQLAGYAIADWFEAFKNSPLMRQTIVFLDNIAMSIKEWFASLKDAEDLPKTIADGIVKFFSNIPKVISAVGTNIWRALKGSFSGEIEFNPLGGFGESIRNGLSIAGQTVVELGKILLEKINDFLSARGFRTISEDAIAGLVNGFKDGASNVWNAAVAMVKSLVQKVKDFLGIHSPSTVFAAIGGFIIAGLVAGLQNGIPDSLGAIKDVFQPMLDWIAGIDFGAVIASVMGVFGVGTAYKAVGALEAIASPFEGLGEIFEGTGEILKSTAKVMSKSAGAIKKILNSTAKVVKSFSGVLNAAAFNMRAEGFKTFVESLVLMIGAIVVMCLLCDPTELWSAVGLVAALAVILVGLAWAMNKINESTASIIKEGIDIKGLSSGLIGIGAAILLMAFAVKMLGGLDPEQAEQGFYGLVGLVGAIAVIFAAFKWLSTGFVALDMTDLGKGLIGIAAALLIMAYVVKILGKMDQGVLIQGGLAIIAFGGIIVGLMAATKLLGSGDIENAGKTILKMALAIGVMAIVAKMLGEMDPWDLVQGGIAIIAFGGIIVGLMAATKLVTGSKHVDTIGGTILKIALAIGVMGIVVKLLSGMEPGDIFKGVLAIAAFGGIIVGLMAATKLVSGSKNVEKIGVTILAISGAIAILALTAFMLSMISWEGFAKGIIMVTLLGGIVVGLMAATKLVSGSKNVDNIGKTLISVAGAIAILALVAVLIGLVPLPVLVKGVAVVAVLSLLMMGLIKATKNATNCMATVLAFAGVIAVMAGAVYLISIIPSDAALISAGILAGLMLVMTGVLKALTSIGKNGKDGLKGVVLLAAIAVILLAFVGILALMQGVENALTSVAALSILTAAMTLVLIPLTFVGKTAKDALKGVIALTAMAIPLLAFVGVLALMQGVENAKTNALILAQLAAVLTLLLLPLSLVGLLVKLAIPGVIALTAMAIPLLAFVGVLALMQGVENAAVNAMVLGSLMTVLGDVLFKISLVAPLALVAVAAIGALVGLITGFGILVTAIGALVTQFPQLQTFLDTGIPIMVQLASGLGEMIGSFISALAGEIMGTLPQLGMCLTQFMVNATGFIVGAKMVDEKVLAGVGILAGAVLALTAADLITGVVSFLQGGSTFADLGTQLSQFMLNAMPFITTAATITPEMMSGVKALAETILILTATDIIQGLTSWLTGGSSLENFAAQLPILGQGLAAFSASLGTFTEDQLNTVNCAANAVKTLAQASSEIPNTGGLLAMLVGENDLGTFAAQFPVLGAGLALFLSSVGTFTEEQVATVTCAANAIKTLAQASSEIPNSGGWLGQIVGENDLGTFAEQFPVLGTGLRGFLDNVGTFTEDQVATVECAANAIKLLAEASSEIPNSGGWIAQIVGENDLGSFAEQFPALGTGLRGFLDNIGTLDDTSNATITAGADAVKLLAQAANSIPNEGGWISKLVGDNNLGTFADNFPSLGEGLAGFVSSLGTFTSDQVSTVYAAVRAIDALSTLADSDLSGATKHLANFGDDLPGFAEDIKSFCSEMPSVDSMTSAVSNLNNLLDAVESIGNANSGCLSDFADNLKKVGKNAVKKFVEAFSSSDAKTDMKDAAKKLADKAIDGVEAKESSIKTAAKKAAKKAVDGVETQEDEMKTAGKDLGKGLVNGIEAKWDAAYDAGYALGQAAVQGEKDGQASNSPSKLTTLAGKWLGEGLVIGIGKMTRSVYNAGHDLGQTATSTISSAVSRVADMVNSDIDAQPTIRPVLDLSDVESGIGSIGGMFGSPVATLTMAGRINASMNSRSQNGVNGDVVNAIDRLNKKMDSLGNTYQINGVTYDDGSNVSNAVKTIVRAARIERRV